MRSRGIDENTARDLLVLGFATEIIDRVSLEPLREYLTVCSQTDCPEPGRNTRKATIAVDELEELYQEIVLEHNRKPRNFRKMDDPTCTSHGFNPFCGDTITLYMTLDENVVRDVSFEAAGCAISIERRRPVPHRPALSTPAPADPPSQAGSCGRRTGAQ